MTQGNGTLRLASEDVIINAPMSFAGSAQRIMRIRRRAGNEGAVVALTALAVMLVVLAWSLIVVWYLLWGLWLVPYRVLRRGARKRKAEALRHREMMGVIEGSAIASASAIVTGGIATQLAPPPAVDVRPPQQRIADSDRDQAIAALRVHMMHGRLSSDELEDRLALAHAAKTWGDLAALQADLPVLETAG